MTRRRTRRAPVSRAQIRDIEFVVTRELGRLPALATDDDITRALLPHAERWTGEAGRYFASLVREHREERKRLRLWHGAPE